MNKSKHARNIFACYVFYTFYYIWDIPSKGRTNRFYSKHCGWQLQSKHEYLTHVCVYVYIIHNTKNMCNGTKLGTCQQQALATLARVKIHKQTKRVTLKTPHVNIVFFKQLCLNCIRLKLLWSNLCILL